MKKITKHFAVLTALITALAVCPITAYAENTNSNQPQIDADLVLAPETRLNVYVDGQWSDTLSDSYGFGDTVTITAPSVSGKSFAYWQADGSVISYNKTLKLTMNAHTTLYAVYASGTTEKPTAGFTSITRTNDGSKISFQAIADSNATSAGIVYSTTATGSKLTIGGTDVENVEAEKLTDSTQTMPKSVLDKNNCWMLQIKPDSATKVYHARAYVTIGETTTYGDVKNVKLSDLENGVSMVANLDGFDPEGSLQDALAGLTSGMKTVTFDANGGTGTMASQAVLSTTDTKLNANTFTRSGYTFSGWNTKANGSGTAYSDGQSVTLSEDTTLYAQWRSTQSSSSKSNQTWTLTMTSYAYDGTAHEPTINGTTRGTVTYTYYNTDTNEELDEAPSAIGNYKVKVYASGNYSYSSRSLTKNYSITDPIDKNGKASVDAFKANDTVPVSDGKIFAGWFTDSTCTKAYTEDTGKAYAKFIDEKILTVKAQITSGTTASSEKTSIRFITSVDSLKYQNVGFKITFNGKTINKKMTKVYTALNANGAMVKPSVFSKDSKYMEAYTLKNIPKSAFGKEFTVTPYYTTQDGTIVEGATNTFTIANMIK